jgi:cobalt-zinc-cadmium resistance protein CzcA
LKSTDSLLDNSIRLAEIRLKSGETDALELSALKSQKGILNSQIQESVNRKLELNLALTQLLNTTEQYSAAVELINLPNISTSSESWNLHPRVRQAELASKHSAFVISLEKQKRLPSFYLGYAGMSMYGMGANERFYNYGQLFQSFQVGLGIPIWGRVHSSRIAAARYIQEAEISNYQYQQKKIRWEYESLWAKQKILQVQYQLLAKLQNTSLKQESEILEQRMQKGDLTILEWNYLIQQQLTLRLEFYSVQEQQALNTVLISSYHFNSEKP